MHEIQKAIERIPIAQVRWTVVKINENEEEMEGKALEESGEARFTINLKRVNKSNSQVVSVSAFPKHKEVSWFIIIANPETNEVMGLTRLTFKRQTQKSLNVLLSYVLP